MFKYSDRLTKAKADSLARKLQTEDRKLRALGSQGNWSKVEVRQTFDGPGGKEYGVFVEKKSNPRGRRTMRRSHNSKAASRWGVYVKGQLAYVSNSKLDANKAASKLRLSGRANITQKAVGPNPISGKVPVVGWRKEFKKAAYSAMKAPGVRRKRARTTSKIRQTRERRGENPKKRLSPSDARIVLRELGIGIDTDFHTLHSNTVDRALDYAKEYGYRKPATASGSKGRYFVQHLQKVARRSNPSPRGISARAAAGRIGRAISRATPTRGYMGRNAGIGTRSVMGGGRLRNPDVGAFRDKLLSAESALRKLQSMRVGQNSIILHGAGKGSPFVVTHPKKDSWRLGELGGDWLMSGAAPKIAARIAGLQRRSNPRSRNAASVLRRRTNPKVVIKPSKDYPNTYDLYVNGKLQVRGETMTVVSNIADSLQRGGRGTRETDDVARSILSRRKRRNPVRTPRSPSAFSNPRKGYVVQVGESIAWVGNLASDAQKAMKKLMDAGFKSVKGFQAKLLGTKLGWRKQYSRAAKRNPAKRAKSPSGRIRYFRGPGGYSLRYFGALPGVESAYWALVKGSDVISTHRTLADAKGAMRKVARKSNPSFGKGRLGSGSRFRKCVSTMKRRGVRSPSGLCASIGRRKYGAKRMAGMAKRGRARRAKNPKGPYLIYRDDGKEYTKGRGIATKAQAIKGAQLVAHANINRSNTIVTVKDSSGQVVARYRATYFGPEKMK